MADREIEFLKRVSKDSLKQQLIGQREGLEITLDLVKTEERTLENMIATVNKSLASLEV